MIGLDVAGWAANAKLQTPENKMATRGIPRSFWLNGVLFQRHRLLVAKTSSGFTINTIGPGEPAL